MRNEILITGGTGFIGSRLALHLREGGVRVGVLGQGNTPAERTNRKLLEERGIQVYDVSVTDRPALAEPLRGVRVVYHLAAAQHEAGAPESHFQDVNVEGTRNVIEAALAAGADRFVHGSTIGVYGDPRGPVDEASPTAPVNVYGRTKLAGERVALEYRERIHMTVIRISEVFGPGDQRLLKLFRMVEKGRFFLIGAGRNLHHPIYISDLVRGLVKAAEDDRPSGEVLILAGRDVVDTNQMVEQVAQAVDRAPPRLRVPLLPFLAAALVMEATLPRVGITPPLHRRRLDFFRKSFSLSGDRARRALGFEAEVGFAEGARLTALWYREQGMLGRSNGLGAGHPNGTEMTTHAPLPFPARPIPELDDDALTARMEPFDSFWEAPEDIEKGYGRFGRFYASNYLAHLPADRGARILVVSCGPGYMVNLLKERGYRNVVGIDSFPDKVAWAQKRGLDCRVARAFTFLRSSGAWDAIFCEQELNHLTKEEILSFLTLCRERLAAGGRIIVHTINGSHPFVASESRAGNFDHFNSWTEYSLKQVLDYVGFRSVQLIPLNLYVFPENPANWIAWGISKLNDLFFRFQYALVGKSARIYSKKIGAVALRA
jgi:nucleoside-diphosphate-sugar epimerase/SAM-dependent methyltransferase